MSQFARSASRTVRTTARAGLVAGRDSEWGPVAFAPVRDPHLVEARVREVTSTLSSEYSLLSSISEKIMQSHIFPDIVAIAEQACREHEDAQRAAMLEDDFTAAQVAEISHRTPDDDEVSEASSTRSTCAWLPLGTVLEEAPAGSPTAVQFRDPVLDQFSPAHPDARLSQGILGRVLRNVASSLVDCTDRARKLYTSIVSAVWLRVVGPAEPSALKSAPSSDESALQVPMKWSPATSTMIWAAAACSLIALTAAGVRSGVAQRIAVTLSRFATQ